MTDSILLIDDDPNLLMLVEHELTEAGLPSIRATSGSEGLSLFDEHAPKVVVLDLGLPDRPGHEVLSEILTRRPDTAVVMLTARGDVDAVLDCMRRGATDFVQKPFDRTRLVTSILNASEQTRLRHRVDSLTSELRKRDGLSAMVGESEALRRALELLARAARSDVTVLIEGESGTGKELAARAIHAESDRSGGPWVAVNCGAIPEGLVESQLFGHEKGAFTGAASAHAGFFEQADGGTIFLDEVSELPANLQVKLLRVLQERVVQRVGATRTRAVDVRVIAAANARLTSRVEENSFRSDLFYRLAVFPIELPALRTRGGDVLLLAGLFLRRFAERHGRPTSGLTQDARKAMTAYHWPGNIRQLENAMERAVILEDGTQIGLGSLPEAVVCALDGTNPSEIGVPEPSEPSEPRAVTTHDDTPASSLSLADHERRLIGEALDRVEGNVTAAATILGIGRATLYRKIERYGFQDRMQRGRRAAGD